MRNNVLIFLSLLLTNELLSQPTDTVKVGSISIKSVFEYVYAFHPVIKQAKLLPQQARFEIREARGFFDPKFAADFAEKKLHPTDLKQTVGEYLVKVISPIREKLNLSEELFEAIKKSY